MTANYRGAHQGLLLATAAGVLWGTVGIASKLMPDGVSLSPFHLGFARLAIAAPLLMLFSALVLGRALWAIPTRVWPWVAAVGVLAAWYQLCLFASLEQLGVARTALLTVCLPPALIAGASALVGHQRPSSWTLGALLLALGGLSLVVGGGSNAHSPVSDAVPLLGLATGTLAAIAFALLSALARTLAGRIHPMQALSFGFVIGAVLLAPIVILSGPAQPQATLGAATIGQYSCWFSCISALSPPRSRTSATSMACSAAGQRPRGSRRRWLNRRSPSSSRPPSSGRIFRQRRGLA